MPNPTIPAAPPLASDLATRTAWEGYELWKSGCALWFEYLSALPGASTPQALMDLNTRFLARSLDLSGVASGELLKDAGLDRPVLNDEC